MSFLVTALFEDSCGGLKGLFLIFSGIVIVLQYDKNEAAECRIMCFCGLQV